jgi:hypothetical protein
VVINIASFAYFCLKLKTMIFYLGDSTSIDFETLDFEKMGNVTLEDAQFTPFFVFKHPNELMPTNIKIDMEEMERYVHMEMVALDYDENREGDEKLVTEILDIEPCTVEHFYGIEEELRLAEAGVEGSTYCPKDMHLYKMRNSIQNFTNKAVFTIRFTTCWTHDDCVTSSRELQKFFDTFYVEVNYMSRKIDFSIYGEAPSRHTTQNLFTV